MRSFLAGAVVLASAVAVVAACTDLKHPDDAAPSGDSGVDGDSPSDAANDATPPADGGLRPCNVDACPTETVLAQLGAPVAVSSAGGHVYLVETATTIPDAGGRGRLLRVPADGTCTSKACAQILASDLESGEVEGGFLALVSGRTRIESGPTTTCYAQSTGSGSHRISCVDHANPVPRIVRGAPGNLTGLHVEEHWLRWVFTPCRIAEVLLDGGSASAIVPDCEGAGAVTHDGTRTYFTENSSDASVPGKISVLAPNGETVRLSADRQDPIALRAHRGYLYWIDADTRKVLRLKTDGSGFVEPLADTLEYPVDLAVDDTGVYWLTAGPASVTGSGGAAVFGAVSHTTLTPGGPVDVMMKELVNAYGLSIDDRSVWVTTVGGKLDEGKLLRTAKTH